METTRSRYLKASSPPGFTPGERGFEDSQRPVFKPWLIRHRARRGRIACLSSSNDSPHTLRFQLLWNSEKHCTLLSWVQTVFAALVHHPNSLLPTLGGGCIRCVGTVRANASRRPVEWLRTRRVPSPHSTARLWSIYRGEYVHRALSQWLKDSARYRGEFCGLQEVPTSLR